MTGVQQGQLAAGDVGQRLKIVPRNTFRVDPLVEVGQAEIVPQEIIPLRLGVYNPVSGQEEDQQIVGRGQLLELLAQPAERLAPAFRRDVLVGEDGRFVQGVEPFGAGLEKLGHRLGIGHGVGETRHPGVAVLVDADRHQVEFRTTLGRSRLELRALDDHVAERRRQRVGRHDQLDQVLLVGREGHVPGVGQLLSVLGVALGDKLPLGGDHPVGEHPCPNQVARLGHFDPRGDPGGVFPNQRTRGGREDVDPGGGRDLVGEDFVGFSRRPDRGLAQGVFEAAGRQEPLHHLGPFQALAKLIGPIKVRKSVQPPIDLPPEKRVAVQRRVIVPLRGPKRPLAVRAHKQGGQRLPGGDPLKRRPGGAVPAGLERHRSQPGQLPQSPLIPTESLSEIGLQRLWQE